MLALTLWQPWASLVVMGEKRIETRDWLPTVGGKPFRGTLLIHAAKETPQDEALKVISSPEFKAVYDSHGIGWLEDAMLSAFPPGAIVGTVSVEDAGEQLESVTNMNTTVAVYDEKKERRVFPMSPQEHAFGWFTSPEEGRRINAEGGNWRKLWRLADPVQFKTPIPCAGNRKLWRPSDEVMEQVRLQLGKQD